VSSITSIQEAGSIAYSTKMATMSVRIRLLRDGLSQEKFGERFGVSREAVSQWEKGKVRPDQTKLEKMADLYGVTLDWIAGKGPDKTHVDKVNNGDNDSSMVASRNDHMQPASGGVTDFLAGPDNLPILGHLGEDDELIIDDADRSGGFTVRPPSLRNVRDAYAVEMPDDSMDSHIPIGAHVLVHPRKPVIPGKHVAVRFKNGRALIRLLVKRTKTELVVKQFKPPREMTIRRSELIAAGAHRVVGYWE